jgi:intracellular sulfur oxidation DsrE/DsrF family protein
MVESFSGWHTGRIKMSNNDTVILVTNYGMGNGPEELRLMLITKYLQLLAQDEYLPSVICFYTDGVKLLTDGSPVLEFLKMLEKKGVRLIVCSTCINYFGIAGKITTGIVGGMTDIIEAQRRAVKVISI